MPEPVGIANLPNQRYVFKKEEEQGVQTGERPKTTRSKRKKKTNIKKQNKKFFCCLVCLSVCLFVCLTVGLFDNQLF